MRKTIKFNPGAKVRYTQQGFKFGYPDENLYDKEGEFIELDINDEKYCYVGFPDFAFATRLEVGALEPIAN